MFFCTLFFYSTTYSRNNSISVHNDFPHFHSIMWRQHRLYTFIHTSISWIQMKRNCKVLERQRILNTRIPEWLASVVTLQLHWGRACWWEPQEFESTDMSFFCLQIMGQCEAESQHLNSPHKAKILKELDPSWKNRPEKSCPLAYVDNKKHCLCLPSYYIPSWSDKSWIKNVT